MRTTSKTLAALLAGIFSVSSYASIEELRYTDDEGVTHEVDASVDYINATKRLNGLVVAGLDRRVSLQVIQGDEIFDSAESGLIGVDDTHEVDGRDRYGKRLSVDLPRSDGDVVLRSLILSAEGDEVDRTDRSITIDRQAPVVHTPVQTQYRRYRRDQWNPVSSRGGGPAIQADVDVSGAPISHAELVMTSQKTGESATIPLSTTSSAVQDQIPHRTYPHRQSWHDMELHVHDVAGNVGVYEWEAKIDAEAPDYEVVGVYDPDNPDSGAGQPWALIPGLEDYVPYESGIRVHNASTHLLLRMPKENHFEYNPFGLYAQGTCCSARRFGFQRAILHEHDGYVYTKTNGRNLVTTDPHNHTVSASSIGADGARNNDRVRIGLVEGTRTYLRQVRNPHTLVFEDGSTTGNRPYLGVDDNLVLTEVMGELREPVDYDVEVRWSPGDNYVVPAGETAFHLKNGRTTGTYTAMRVCYVEGDGMCSSSNHATVFRNTSPPEIESWEYGGLIEQGVYEYSVDSYVRYSSTNSAYRFGNAWIYLKQDGETVHEIRYDAYTNASHDHSIDFVISDIESGVYDVHVRVEDRVGNTDQMHLETREFDVDAPQIELTLNNQEWGSEEVGSLADIGVIVTSDRSEPSITDITLSGGPAGDNYGLAWRQDAGGVYRLEYPLMFPSMEAGEEYQISVGVKDEQLNTATENKTFHFQPNTTVINGETGVLMPAVQEVVLDKSGVPPISSEPVMLGDGSKLVGQYDLVATLRSDSEFSINLFGYELEPGDTVVIDGYDFSRSESRIVLPAYPLDDTVGQANLLINPSAPGSDYVLANIRTWLPDPVASINHEDFLAEHEISQALEPVRFDVNAGAGDECAYTDDPQLVLESDPLSEPMCYVDVDIPETMEWVEGESFARGYLSGTDHDARIAYRIYLPQGDDHKAVLVDSSETHIEVVEPDIEFSFHPGEPVIRYIEQFERSLRSSGSVDCSPVLNPERARSMRHRSTTGCLIEWTQTPAGVLPNPLAPGIEGVARETQLIAPTFDVTYFDPDANAYFMVDQSAAVEVEEPEELNIELPEPDAKDPDTGDALYFISATGGDMGESSIQGSPADIDVMLNLNGSTVRDYNYLHRGGFHRPADFRYRMWLPEMDLWSQHPVSLGASYELMPEIGSEAQAQVIAVPDEGIQARIELGDRETLDTEEVSALIYLRGRALGSDGYDPELHGDWDARVVKRVDRGEYKALTDWEPINGLGELETQFSMEGLNTGRVMAELRLDSPYEHYSRSFKSNHARLQVLRGGAIDGDLSATRISGRSPLSVMLSVEIEDRSYESALGDVTWFMSTDDGQSWDELENEGARPDRWRDTLEAGEYLLKAQLENQYTGVISQTPEQPILVYDVPRVQVEGARYAFIGQEIDLDVSTTLNWEPVPSDNYHIEWSVDNGESWEQSDILTLSAPGESAEYRIRTRVRDHDAPLDENQIYGTASHRLEFIPPEAPRARIRGPRRLERGEPGEFEVSLRAPRPDMDIDMNGQWILPDGEVIEGMDNLVYDASEEDVEEGRAEIQFAAWVEGFADNGAFEKHSYSVLPWQYVWPEWDLFASTRALQAPAEIRLTPRTPGWFGWLDNEQFEWVLPESADLLEIRGDRPTVRFEEPGEHLVAVRVTDDRGNESFVERAIKLDEPDEPMVVFRKSADNRYWRAPTLVRPRVYMDGGHALDRVDEIEILVNGESVARDSRASSFTLEQPGDYEVTARIYTTMGKVAETTESVNIVPNQTPTCNPTIDDGWGVTVRSNCQDEDGRIVDMNWVVNGEVIDTRSRRYSFSDRQIEEMGGSVNITVSAIDDAGVESEPVSISYTK